MTNHDSAYENVCDEALQSQGCRARSAYAEMPMSKLDHLSQNPADWDPSKDLS